MGTRGGVGEGLGGGHSFHSVFLHRAVGWQIMLVKMSNRMVTRGVKAGAADMYGVVLRVCGPVCAKLGPHAPGSAACRTTHGDWGK